MKSNKIWMIWLQFAFFVLTVIFVKDNIVVGIVAGYVTISNNYLFKIRAKEKIEGV